MRLTLATGRNYQVPSRDGDFQKLTEKNFEKSIDKRLAACYN